MPKPENKRKERESVNASQNLHNYASTSANIEAPMEASDFALNPLPDTPLQSPVTKKGKPAAYDEDSLVTRLSSIINSRADSLEKKVTIEMEGLKKTINFVSEELKDIKKKIKEVDAKVKKDEQRVSSCESRITELERYSRRWNLRLAGVPENDLEDVKVKVVDICQKTIMNENVKVAEGIDVVHRLGKKDHNKRTPRNIIIRFLSRTLRDVLWKTAKQSTFLRENKMRFAEDLTAADRERRQLLWPQVQEARALGKTTYFIAGRAFANGAEIFPPPAT